MSMAGAIRPEADVDSGQSIGPFRTLECRHLETRIDQCSMGDRQVAAGWIVSRMPRARSTFVKVDSSGFPSAESDR